MNSKQRRSIWREHQAQIEPLEFQYRVLSGTKPDRSVTLIVPKYLELLQRAVAARRKLKSQTGSSKGWCGNDPFETRWPSNANLYAGSQWNIQQRAALRRSKSWTSGLSFNTIIIDESTKFDAVQHRQSVGRIEAHIAADIDAARTLGAEAGASDTSSGSAHRALSRQVDDQVDALVRGFCAYLDRNPPSL